MIVTLIFFSGINAIAQNTSDENSFATEELLWIKEHPEIKSINGMEWPPFDFAEDGIAKGYSIDFLNLVAAKIGFKIKYVNGYPYGGLLKLLNNREVDMAQSIIQTPEREEYLDFTQPYYGLPMVYFGAKGADTIANINSLDNKKIGVAFGDVPLVVYAAQYRNLDLTVYKTILEAFYGLKNGEVDALPSILPVGNYIINKYEMNNIHVIGETFYPDTGNEGNIRLAARNDWPILNVNLSKGIDLVTEDKRLSLFNKWQIGNINANEIDLSIEEIKWLSVHKIINVVTDPNVAPIEFIDQKGEIKGIAGTYLEKIAAKLNIQFRWVGNKNWAEGMATINDKRADVVSNIIRTPEREEQFEFTDSFLKVTAVIFAREGKIEFSDLMMLDGDVAVNRDKSKDKEYLDHINESGRSLLAIINDILDISKVEAGKIETFIEEFDAVSEIENCVSSFYTMCKETDVTISSELEETTLLSDEKLFRQIMRNILSNAIKLIPEGGTVSITNQFEEKYVHFSISDTGIGMDDDELKVALESFGQVQSSYSKEYQGTGLGLPLVNKFMEILDGKLNISSQKNIGTTVKLSFPI